MQRRAAGAALLRDPRHSVASKRAASARHTRKRTASAGQHGVAWSVRRARLTRRRCTARRSMLECAACGARRIFRPRRGGCLFCVPRALSVGGFSMVWGPCIARRAAHADTGVSDARGRRGATRVGAARARARRALLTRHTCAGRRGVHGGVARGVRCSNRLGWMCVVNIVNHVLTTVRLHSLRGTWTPRRDVHVPHTQAARLRLHPMHARAKPCVTLRGIRTRTRAV